MIPALIAKIGVPLLASVIADALKDSKNPVAQGAAKALGDLDAAVISGDMSDADIAEANRHAEKMAELRLKEYEAALQEVNESLRAEISSEDIYVRRWRPTFGYLMATTWAAQMMAVAYIMIFKTAQAPDIMEAVESLSVIWTAGLSVLGLYVYQRSAEKKASL